jgi:hypothetical protein
MRFIKQPDSNFLDSKTGLIWKEFSEQGLFTWDEANDFEDDFYRLPTIDELHSLITKKQHSRLYTNIPNTKESNFWSSSQYNPDDIGDSYRAYVLHFDYGDSLIYYKSSKHSVRLLRR